MADDDEGPRAPRRFGIRAAAKYLQCSETRVRRLRAAGDLPKQTSWTQAELDEGQKRAVAKIRPPGPAAFRRKGPPATEAATEDRQEPASPANGTGDPIESLRLPAALPASGGGSSSSPPATSPPPNGAPATPAPAGAQPAPEATAAPPRADGGFFNDWR